MTKENRFNMDPSWKGVYQASGLSLFAGGAIIVIFLLSVFIMQVPLPLTPQAVLENSMPPVILFSLAALGEFLLMPGVLGLYLSLKDVKKTYTLIGTAVWLAAIPMFLVSRGQIIWVHSKWVVGTPLAGVQGRCTRRSPLGKTCPYQPILNAPFPF